MRFIRAFSVRVARQRVAQPGELKAAYQKTNTQAGWSETKPNKNQASTARF